MPCNICSLLTHSVSAASTFPRNPPPGFLNGSVAILIMSGTFCDRQNCFGHKYHNGISNLVQQKQLPNKRIGRVIGSDFLRPNWSLQVIVFVVCTMINRLLQNQAMIRCCFVWMICFVSSHLWFYSQSNAHIVRQCLFSQAVTVSNIHSAFVTVNYGSNQSNNKHSKHKPQELHKTFFSKTP